MTHAHAEQLEALARHEAPNSVSVWMTTHPMGAEIRQDPIRMKNLLTEAGTQLIKLGKRAPDADRQIAPVRETVGQSDNDFWRHQSDGLGVFVGEDQPTMLHVPLQARQVVMVSEHYHIKPLFALDRLAQAAYVLKLSENGVRLVRCDGAVAQPVDLPGVAESFEVFMRADDPERHVEFHTETADQGPGGDRPAVFHGQGSGADESHAKRHLEHYCRQIDQAVTKLLKDRTEPLLLAATEPMQGIYRRLSHCPQLDERTIEGNPDRLSDDALRDKALASIQADADRPIQEATETYHRARGAGLATDELEKVLQAAQIQNVDTLLVAMDEEIWGLFDPETCRVERHETQQPGDEDLLNLAAILAYRGGATVHAVPRDEIPGQAPAAAALRYDAGG